MNHSGDPGKILYEWFGSGDKKGIFSKLIDSYEYREHQVLMATAIAEAINRREHLIVEAGTGVGKTLAYLVPLIALGKKAVISTATKTLQEQLVKKDIPLLTKIPGVKLDLENDVCVLKGRTNYVCKRKLGLLQQNILHGRFDQIIGATGDIKAFRKFMIILKRWLKETVSGDVSEFIQRLLTSAPSEFQGVSFLEEKLSYLLGATSDQCSGSSCSFFSGCFVLNARKKAQKAQLVVVNHHLLCTDLAGKFFQSFEIIPSGDVLIIDEAHRLPDVIAHAFTLSYYSSQINRLMEEIEMVSGRRGKIWKSCCDMVDKIYDYHSTVTSFLLSLIPESNDERERKIGFHRVLNDEETKTKFKNLLNAISQCYNELALLFDEAKDDHLAVITTIRRTRDILLEFTREEFHDTVPWFELENQGFSLHLTPLNAETSVSDLLLSSYSSIIFTSATIAVAHPRAGPEFDYFKKEVGIPQSTASVVIGSPYNYENQMICFIPPKDFPAPDEPEFIDTVLRYAVPIIKAFAGGVLFLCTSYRNMKALADGLRKSITDRRILVQGEASRTYTLDEFRLDKNSILVATGTFWEGIDVPGESLQVLLIDKLPFPSPGDPIVEGRSKRLHEAGRDPFLEYFLPRMILTLRQGIGRLIRSSKDYGLVGIFDVRVRTKNYGRQILSNLPSCKIIERIEDLTISTKQLTKDGILS